MAWDALTTAEIAVGKPVTNALMTKIKGDLDYLYGQSALTAVVGIPNGSFEVDEDADGTPDTWTAGVYSGGTKTLEATGGIDGAQCVKFVHPGGAGNGGGWMQSDYIPVGQLLAHKYILFSYYSTVAGPKVMAEIQYYDIDHLAVGSAYTAYLCTANPTAWTVVALQDFVIPSSTVRFLKLKLIFGYTDTNVAASMYVDDVRLSDTAIVLRGIQIAETINQSEVGSTNASYEDVGSTVSITVPSWAKYMGVFHLVKAETSAGTAYIRFRLDSNYSSETAYVCAAGDTKYPVHTPMLLDVSALAGSRTFSFQSKQTSAGTLRSYVESLSANTLKYYIPRLRISSMASGGAGGYYLDN